ncbi:MAG: nickel-dependent lactate racemase [Candidatus Bathyarchaeia archaeon]
MTERMSALNLPYDDKHIRIELPMKNLSCIIDIGHVSHLHVVEDPYRGVETALRNPISHSGIKESVKKGDKVVILGDDITRPTPCGKLIPPILDLLNEAGVPDRNIKIIVSTGTHRPLTIEEFRRKFGDEAFKRVEIINHDFKDKEKLAYMGVTPLGTPIWVNREFYQADFKIGLGAIIPHPFGWGGGGKIVEPGICGLETIYKVHRLAASFSIHGLIGDSENPVRREIDEVALQAGLDLIVNVVMGADGKILGLYAGDVVKAHREGVKLAEKIYRPGAPARTDIVIVGSPSLAVNIDYWQAVKGALAASCLVKEGGTIIMATPCYEGIPIESHPEISRIGALPYDQALREIDKGGYMDPSLPGFIAIHGQVRDKSEVMIFSDHLSERDCELLGLKKVGSVEEAIGDAFKKHGKDATIGILRHFEVFPRIIG